jgi:hypothetical protein
MFKIDGKLPSKQVFEYLQRNAHKIADVEYGGGYSHPNTGRDCNAYNILLRSPWRIEDCHTIIEPTAVRVIEELEGAETCDCEDCRSAIKARGIMVPLWGNKRYATFRWRKAGKGAQPTKPERIEVRRIVDGKAVELVGQDAEDFIDQMTHGINNDGLCASVLELKA